LRGEREPLKVKDLSLDYEQREAEIFLSPTEGGGPHWYSVELNREEVVALFPRDRVGVIAPRKHPGGAKPKYPWDEMREHLFQLLETHGMWTAEDPDWSCQADAERALLAFADARCGKEPAVSGVRERMPRWIAEYLQRSETRY
jgi:hypothetical protein